MIRKKTVERKIEKKVRREARAGVGRTEREEQSMGEMGERRGRDGGEEEA